MTQISHVLLLKDSYYPAIHTVGRASYRPPALIDIRWSPPTPPAHGGAEVLPLLCLVGKGVCFDSGGLDIKSAAGMKLMKKAGEMKPSLDCLSLPDTAQDCLYDMSGRRVYFIELQAVPCR